MSDWPEIMPNTSNPANADEQLRAARQSRLPQRDQPAPRRMFLLSHPRLSASLPLAQEMAGADARAAASPPRSSPTRTR